MKALAIRCSFENATRCTGQGKRVEGVSWLVNSKEIIPLCESMRVLRHNSVDAHLGYTETDEEVHGKRYRAMGAKTNYYLDKNLCASLIIIVILCIHLTHYFISS